MRVEFPREEIDACRRISFASRSRLFFALRARTSSDSAVLTPGRAPASTWAWFTQRRNASREMPSCELTALQAAVVDP